MRPAADIILPVALGCVDLLFKPKEVTDQVEKAQEVPCQFNFDNFRARTLAAFSN